MKTIITFTFNLVCSLALRLGNLLMKLWHKPELFLLRHKWKINQNVHVMYCVWRRLNNVASCFCLSICCFSSSCSHGNQCFCPMKPKNVSPSIWLNQTFFLKVEMCVSCRRNTQLRSEKWHLALFSYLQLIKAPAFCFISSRALVDIEPWQRTLMIEGGTLKNTSKW